MRKAALLLLLAAACDDLTLFGPPDDVVVDPPLGGGADAGVDDEEDPQPCTAVREGTYEAGPALVVARTRHTATALKDGRVLLAGGQDADYLPTATAEVYDPANDAFTATGAMATARYDHAAAILPDGRVAVFGGFDMQHLASVEIWDPEDDAWSPSTDLPSSRAGHTATVLPDGRVVLLGGQNLDEAHAAILVFDPTDATFDDVGSIGQGRSSHAATLLSDGRILMSGGYFAGALPTVDVIAADLSSATNGAPLPSARRSHGATLLPDGRVLVTGGVGGPTGMDDAHTYDPDDDAWTRTGTLNVPRYAHESVVLGCAVLLCGGVDAAGCEAFDLDDETFTAVPGPAAPSFSFSLTKLQDGSALLAGGTVGDAATSASARFVPAE